MDCPTMMRNSCVNFSIQDDYPEIALGAAAGVATLGVNYCLGEAIETVLLWCDLRVTELQDVAQIFDWFNSLQNIVLKVALKVLFALYCVVIGPWIEEFVFREWLHENMGGDGGETSHKVCRVFWNGIAFGAMHLSPFNGLANIPIFIITSVMGMGFEALRIWRGNRVACTTAHMVHNAIGVGLMLA